jgi:dihydroneopterin aldolase
MDDRVLLRGIAAQTLVGVHAHERLAQRAVILDLELTVDLDAAARSDRLTDTVDYSALVARVRARCAASSYLLIEALARAVAESCLEDPRVLAVTVTLHKPDAVAGVHDIAVALSRTRSGASRNETS